MRFKILNTTSNREFVGEAVSALGVQTAVGAGAAGPKNAGISFDIFLPLRSSDTPTTTGTEGVDCLDRLVRSFMV